MIKISIKGMSVVPRSPIICVNLSKSGDAHRSGDAHKCADGGGGRGVTRLKISEGDAADGSIFEEYLRNKRGVSYQLPSSPIKIMKGEFFYDYKLKRYRIDPTGWWYSEKLDGIRCIWTGVDLRTRSDRLIHAPDWWTSGLPKNIALDGELYIGRKRFADVQGLGTRTSVEMAAWEDVKFHVFDIPDSCLPYYKTYRIIQEVVKRSALVSDAESGLGGNVLVAVKQFEITGLSHLIEEHRKLVLQGAEGTMIRDPMAIYTPFKTVDLLKFKSQVDKRTGKLSHLYDDVAIVVGYKTSDKWSRADGTPALKSLEVHWLDKYMFPMNPEFSVSLKLTKQERCGDYRSLFPLGTEIRILYTELFDSQKPRFPRYGGLVM